MPPVTSRVPGNGSTTISYTIPGSGLDVETVRVSVDATAAAGAVTATVTITDQSGVVIATKPQNSTIPAGAIGSATWALRLDDDTGSGGGTDPLAVHFNTSPQTNSFLEITTTQAGTGVLLENTGGGSVNISAQGSAASSVVDITADAQVFTGSPEITERVGASGDYTIEKHTGATLMQVQERGEFELNLGLNRSLTVFDSGGNPIFRIDEGAGTPAYHLKTGGAWVADL